VVEVKYECVSDSIGDTSGQFTRIGSRIALNEPGELLFKAIRILEGKFLCVSNQVTVLELAFYVPHRGCEAMITIVAICVATLFLSASGDCLIRY